MPIIVGSVGVQVYPDVTNFWTDFRTRTRAGAEQAGRQIAQDLSQHIAASLSRAVTQGLQSSAPGQQGRRAGVDYSDAFTREVKTRIEAAVRSLGPRIRVDANTDPAVAEMENLRRKIRETDAHLRIGRIDDAQALAQIQAIQTRLAEIARQSPNVRVRVNAGQAQAQLAALQAQTSALGASVATIGTSAAGSAGGMSKLVSAALLLSPALIPIGAAAVPAVLALGAAGGVAALAFFGLKNGVDAIASSAVKAQLNSLTHELSSLSGVAASGAAFGLVQGMRQLGDLAPQLTNDVSLIAAQLAGIASNSAVGLVRILQVSAPLSESILQSVLGFSKGFATFGDSPEFRRFLEYAAAKIPEVQAFLVEFGTAVGHIVEAAAPWGSIVLASLTAVSSAISAIPLPILTELVTVFEVIIALRFAGALSAIGLSTAAMTTAFTVARAAGAGLASSMGAAAVAAGPMLLAVAAIAAAGYGLTHMSAKMFDVKANYDNLTAAIRADNLALGENTKQALATSLQTNGLADAARKAGMSTQDLVDGITGSDQAFADLGVNLGSAGVLSYDLARQLREMREGFEHDKVAAKDLDSFFTSMAPKVRTLGDVYAGLSVELGISGKQLEDYAGRLGLTKGTSSELSGVVTQLASQYMVANSAQSKLIDATLAYAASAGTAADQATYLGAVLVSSQGDTLGVADSLAQAFGAARTFGETVKGDSKLQSGLREMANKLDGVNLATADLSTYSDIFSSASAPAVTQALSGIQQQGEAAAKAWYEHQVGIVGTQQAADEASALFTTTTHDALVGLAGQLGISEEQAGLLADNLLRTPEKTPLEIVATGLASANDTLQTLVLTLSQINGKTFTTYSELKLSTTVTPGSAADFRLAEIGNQADGGIDYPMRNGGVMSYAAGGFNSKIAQIVPDGSNILFAEHGTGGEAFIPMGMQNRARSTAILGTVANEFGLALTKSVQSYSTGAVVGSAGIASSSDGVLLGEVRALRGAVRELGDHYERGIERQGDTLRLTVSAGSNRVNS